MSLVSKIDAYIDDLAQRGLLRERLVTEPSHSSHIYFDNNDYLSLTSDPRIAKAYQSGYSQYPSGSGASMLLSGYHPNHQALERAFTTFLGVDDCLLFSSGYAANLAVASLSVRIQASCLVDKNIHASVYDGLALAGAKYSRFIHNDVLDLERKLSVCKESPVVFTEGVFSMSGQQAPLSVFSSLCRQYQAGLVVDEAHAFGILGEQGRGAVNHCGLTQEEVPLRVIVFGKAFAAQGALVAGKKEWIHALVQAGRSVIYSTAISPALCYGLLKTLDIVIAADDRRAHLKQLIRVFKDHIKTSPLDWIDSDTPIQLLRLGCPHTALHYAQELKKKGLSCFAVRSPTVNAQSTGLRVVLNYQHQPQHLEQLFNMLHLIYERTHH